MTTLHVLNGGACAQLLAASGVEGESLVYAEIYHEGPVPEVDDGDWLSIRAAFMEARGLARADEYLRRQRKADAALARIDSFDEVVFWFEHDLYDQLLLIRHLDWLARTEAGLDRTSLICIGGFPGYDDFHGLGELEPDDFASLMGSRKPIEAAQVSLGQEAWMAFRSRDPAALVEILERNSPVLPFLAGALHRHLEEFPSVENGLSRNHLQILRSVLAGFRTPGALFRRVIELEESPYLGDTTFFASIEDLCACPTPLLKAEDGGRFLRPRSPGWEVPAGFRDRSLLVTEAGENVLAGLRDALELNGIDRWLGGVHLRDGGPIWRWDGLTRRLARS